MQELKSSGELQEHMLWTYYGLRVGLAAIGIDCTRRPAWS